MNSYSSIVAERLTQLAKFLKEKQFLSEELAASLAGQASMESLLAYSELLQRWTTKVDLVAPAAAEELFERHIVDSIAALAVLSSRVELSQRSTILDVGTGAGLPGIVWAILAPELELLLCEPRQKRVLFLEEALRLLKLRNCRVLRARSEEINRDDFPALELVVNRALGAEKEFLIGARRLLGAAGDIALLAGPSWKEQASVEGVVLDSSTDYELSENGPSRKLVLWKCST